MSESPLLLILVTVLLTVAATYFTLGSSKKELLAVLGTPKNVVGDTWFYDPGYVDFHNSVVSHVRAYSDESYMKFRIDPSKL